MSYFRQLAKDELNRWSRVFLCIAVLSYVGGAQETFAQSSPSTSASALRAGLIPVSTLRLGMASGTPAHRTAANQSSINEPGMMMMEMPLIAPLFVQDERTSSVITMVNEIDKDVNASLELFAPDGTLAAADNILFGPHTQRVMNVAEVLEKAHSTQTSGWVRIVPNPKQTESMAIAAQLSLTTDVSGSSSYAEEEFLMQRTFNGSNTWRAASAPNSHRPLIALVNVSEKELSAAVTCLEEGQTEKQRSIQLSPHQRVVTFCGSDVEQDEPNMGVLLDPSRTESGSYGIGVTSNGSPGDVLAYAIAASDRPAGRDLLGINFVNTGTAKSPDTVFTGVPMGHFDLLPGGDFKPKLSVANFGNSTAHISVKHAYTDGDTSTARVIDQFAVPPKSAKQAVLSVTGGDQGERNSFVITSDQAPGLVYSSMLSLAEPSGTVVQLLGKDRLQGENGGGHPWNIDGDKQSTLLLFNHSDRPQIFTVNLAADTLKWQHLYTLASNETRAISINHIVRSREKDAKGKVLSSTATSGDVSWFTPFMGQGSGRLLVSSAATGLARNFSCGYNIVLCGAGIYTSAISFALGVDSTPLYLGDIYGLTCTAYDPNACSGDSYGSGGGYSYSWDSSNSSITPISGSTTSASVTLHGQSLGQGGAYGFVSNGNCSPSAGGTGTVDNNWATVFGLPNDGTQILISQASYNTLVANHIIAAGAGVIVFVPVGGEIVILISIVVVATVLTYAAAQYISSHNISVTPPPRRPCTLAAQTSGPNGVTCAYNCPGYGALATFSCPAGKKCAATLPDGLFKASRDCQ